MAALIWTEPALQDLDAIADYIALHNPVAAGELVQRVFQHVEQLQRVAAFKRRRVHAVQNDAEGATIAFSRHRD